MEFMRDWHVLKAAVEEERAEALVQDSGEAYGRPKKFMLNKTDILIIQTLLAKEKRSLKELRADVQRSRVSVYLSLRKLRDFSLILAKVDAVSLRKNDLVDCMHQLLREGFDFSSLVGERIVILQSLLNWRGIDQISVECNISPPSVYKYLSELTPFIAEEDKSYRIREDKKSLIGFLRTIRDLSERVSETFRVWSSAEGELLKTKNSVNGSLTAFSRFADFGVDYSPEFFYYYIPKKELVLEEIFVHSLRCSDDDDMLSKAYEFYVKNNRRMDVLYIDELALRFSVVDSWLSLQGRVLESNGYEGVGTAKDVYYLSPENAFLSKSLSNDCGDILGCERILRMEKLCWEIMFPEYVKQLREPGFRWHALISRFRIMEERTGVRIPILKKLSNLYLEKALAAALKKPKTVNELKNEFNLPEYHLRNMLRRMVKMGLIHKTDTKPIRFSIHRSS